MSAAARLYSPQQQQTCWHRTTLGGNDTVLVDEDLYTLGAPGSCSAKVALHSARYTPRNPTNPPARPQQTLIQLFYWNVDRRRHVQACSKATTLSNEAFSSNRLNIASMGPGHGRIPHIGPLAGNNRPHVSPEQLCKLWAHVTELL
jgi:hypothetical protein